MSKFLTPPSWYDKNGSKIDIFDNTTYDSMVKNTAIGDGAIAGRPSGCGAVAVGYQAHAEGDVSIAIGSYDEKGGSSPNVEALAAGSIAIGGRAKANADSTDGIAIGHEATSEHGGIAIGGYVKAAGIGSIAIGNGTRTDTDSNHGIAIGFGATSKMGGIAIGSIAYATANQIQLGNSDTAYTLNIGDGTGEINTGTITLNGVRLSASGGVIQLGNNNTAYTLNIGNGNASIGNFEITPIKTGDYANQVVLGNINQIKAPMAGISFEVGERRETGTIIFPSKIKTLMVDSIQYSVGAISKTSTNGSLKLSANCLYVINFGSMRAMLHTTTNNSNTHQFIYSIDSTVDYVIYVDNVLSDTTSVTCKLQKYNKSNNTYTDYTDSNFTAIKVCSFT